jgi:hypothetical protein
MASMDAGLCSAKIPPSSLLKPIISHCITNSPLPPPHLSLSCSISTHRGTSFTERLRASNGASDGSDHAGAQHRAESAASSFRGRPHGDVTRANSQSRRPWRTRCWRKANLKMPPVFLAPFSTDALQIRRGQGLCDGHAAAQKRARFEPLTSPRRRRRGDERAEPLS